MTADELIALIETEEANCISTTSGALAEQRREAMQYYYGKPYGNEVEGRSQVVTTEVKDAIEGVLPTLMAIFVTSDEIVRFEPQGPEDEAAARQETDYVNLVFSRLNNGFMVLYCLFKDALLQKNGYAKVYWEKYEETGIESYEKLSDIELAYILQTYPELKIDKHTAYNDPQTLEPVHDVVFRRTEKRGRICVDPVPPEEVLISRSTSNQLAKSRFVEHRTKKTISQIREMGFTVADDIQDDTQDAEFNLERQERLSFDDANAGRDESNPIDKSAREVWYREAYLYVDFDGDDIGEYRKVSLIGKTLLDNVEFDSLPLVGGSAIPVPHKHYGMSFHDLVGDIQLIKSTITRQLLDNAYVANNGRLTVMENMVNMEDLLTSRPNGIIRMRAMGAVQRLDNPLLGASFYSLLDYFDKMKQNRVGATDFPNAVDPDAINAKATFVEAFRNAALERVNLMARILAEGPIKELFYKIREVESKHRDKAQMVQLRGKWVNVDPREWKTRRDMTVTVGLGTGSQQTILQGAQLIFGMQLEMLKAGLGDRVVTPMNLFQSARTAARSVFPKDYEAFFDDPTGKPAPPPPPNPDLLKIQLAAEKAKLGDKQKRDKMAMDAMLELKRMGIDLIALANEANQHDKEMRMDEMLQGADQEHAHVEGMFDRAAQVAASREAAQRTPPQ